MHAFAGDTKHVRCWQVSPTWRLHLHACNLWTRILLPFLAMTSKGCSNPSSDSNGALRPQTHLLPPSLSSWRAGRSSWVLHIISFSNFFHWHKRNCFRIICLPSFSRLWTSITVMATWWRVEFQVRFVVFLVFFETFCERNMKTSSTMGGLLIGNKTAPLCVLTAVHFPVHWSTGTQSQSVFLHFF